MEIIDRENESGDDLVQIAFAETREEAALIRGLLREQGIRSLAKQGAINGPSLGAGLLTSSPRRIYVVPAQAEAARTLLGEIMVEDPAEEEIPEPANARYLDEARGHKPRNYNLIGAYSRAWLWSLALLAIAFAVFLLLR
jgi:hypothetical protein